MPIKQVIIPKSPLEPTAIRRDDLRCWFPMTPPFDWYYTTHPLYAGSPSEPYIPDPSCADVQTGEHNSLRGTTGEATWGDRARVVYIDHGGQYAPFTWSFWFKPYDMKQWRDSPRVGLVSSHHASTYWTMAGYAEYVGFGGEWMYSGNLWYGTHIYVPLNNYHHTGAGFIVQPDEWLHYIVTVRSDMPTTALQFASIYANGRRILGPQPIDGGHILPNSGVYLIGPFSLGNNWATGNCAMKDFRHYYGEMTDAEALTLYEESLAYFNATSGLGLLNSTYLPMDVVLPVECPSDVIVSGAWKVA